MVDAVPGRSEAAVSSKISDNVKKERKAPFYWTNTQKLELLETYETMAADEGNTTEQKKNLKASAWNSLVSKMKQVNCAYM